MSLSPSHQEMVALHKLHANEALTIVHQALKAVKVSMGPQLEFDGDTTKLFTKQNGRKGHLAEKVPDVVVELCTKHTKDIISFDEILVLQPDYTPKSKQGSGMKTLKYPQKEGGFTKVIPYSRSNIHPLLTLR